MRALAIMLHGPRDLIGKIIGEHFSQGRSMSRAFWAVRLAVVVCSVLIAVVESPGDVPEGVRDPGNPVPCVVDVIAVLAVANQCARQQIA